MTDPIEAARDEIDRLCTPGERWRMSIPANPARDSDLILTAGLNAMNPQVVLKSTPADRAAVLGDGWNGSGWTAPTTDHAWAAEELLAEAQTARADQAALYIAAAQVHATLALAQATKENH